MTMLPPAPGPEDECDAMAMDYVLGTTTIFERRAAEARLAKDEDFRAAVAHWQAVLSPLDEDTAPVAPPPGLWAGIAAQVQPAPPLAMAAKTVAAPENAVPWRVLAIGGAVLVAAAVAALLL